MRSGDKCPKCKGGRLRVRTSNRVGDWQRQHLECKECGNREVAVVAAESVWRRGIVQST